MHRRTARSLCAFVRKVPVSGLPDAPRTSLSDIAAASRPDPRHVNPATPEDAGRTSTAFQAETAGIPSTAALEEAPRFAAASAASAKIPKLADYWQAPTHEAMRVYAKHTSYFEILHTVAEHNYLFLFADLIRAPDAPLPHVMYEDMMKALTFSSMQRPPEEQFALPKSIVRSLLSQCARHVLLDPAYFPRVEAFFRLLEQQQSAGPEAYSAFVMCCAAAGQIDEALAFAVFMEAHHMQFDTTVFALMMQPSLDPRAVALGTDAGGLAACSPDGVSMDHGVAKGIVLQKRLCDALQLAHGRETAVSAGTQRFMRQALESGDASAIAAARQIQTAAVKTGGTASAVLHAMMVYYDLTQQPAAKWEALRKAVGSGLVSEEEVIVDDKAHTDAAPTSERTQLMEQRQRMTDAAAKAQQTTTSGFSQITSEKDGLGIHVAHRTRDLAFEMFVKEGGQRCGPKSIKSLIKVFAEHGEVDRVAKVLMQCRKNEAQNRDDVAAAQSSTSPSSHDETTTTQAAAPQLLPETCFSDAEQEELFELCYATAPHVVSQHKGLLRALVDPSQEAADPMPWGGENSAASAPESLGWDGRVIADNATIDGGNKSTVEKAMKSVEEANAVRAAHTLAAEGALSSSSSSASSHETSSGEKTAPTAATAGAGSASPPKKKKKRKVLVRLPNGERIEKEKFMAMTEAERATLLQCTGQAPTTPTAVPSVQSEPTVAESTAVPPPPRRFTMDDVPRTASTSDHSAAFSNPVAPHDSTNISGAIGLALPEAPQGFVRSSPTISYSEIAGSGLMDGSYEDRAASGLHAARQNREMVGRDVASMRRQQSTAWINPDVEFK